MMNVSEKDKLVQLKKAQLAKANMMRTKMMHDEVALVASTRPSSDTDASTTSGGTVFVKSQEFKNRYGEIVDKISIGHSSVRSGINSTSNSIIKSSTTSSSSVKSSTGSNLNHVRNLNRVSNNIKNNNTLSIRAPDIPVPSSVIEAPASFQCDMFRSTNIHQSGLFPSIEPPTDPRGRLVDLCDRPILCCSVFQDEVVFGSSDHALYSIDTHNSNKRHKTMYSKAFGHTDWVTSVSHLPDGRVVSSAMDGKLCLWDSSRSKCIDLLGHTGSIAKVVTDAKYNVAVSCGYDKKIIMWSFPIDPLISGERLKMSSSRKSHGSGVSGASFCKPLLGHKDAVLEVAFDGSSLASGSRDGGFLLWDLNEYVCMRALKGHKGAITAVDSVPSSSGLAYLTAGVDGYVRRWDGRCSGAEVLSCQVPVHVSMKDNRAAAISVLVQSNDYVITGGADSCINVLDSRQSFKVVGKYEHPKIGIYSLCCVDNQVLYVGDGGGTVLCYDFIRNELKYGLGACEKGGVRALCMSSNTSSSYLVAGTEDGKALCWKIQ